MTKKAPKTAKPSTRKKPIYKPKSVVISILLDESGSMMSLRDSTIAGYNEYVDALRTKLSHDDVHFSAIKFDTGGIVKLQVGAKIENAVRLSHLNYTPNGGTPLHDAIARTIQATDEVAGKNKADKIIVVIQTDGAENASTEYRLDKIKTMVEERQGKGWEFVFIGAGIDAFSAGTMMGFAAMNTMSYGANAQDTQVMFAATANNSAAYLSGTRKSMAYTAAQSQAVGESKGILRAKLNAKK